MSLERLKTNLLKKARDYGTLNWKDAFRKPDRYGRVTPTNSAFNKRVRAALNELMTEGKLEGDMTNHDACMNWKAIDP